jgi:hypothetical protein
VSACNKPKYSSLVKNLRATTAVVAELSNLSGEAQRQQQAWLNELLANANE